ncbi:hypothetical protein ACWGNE_02485 [Streptomyces xiamenensis]
MAFPEHTDRVVYSLQAGGSQEVEWSMASVPDSYAQGTPGLIEEMYQAAAEAALDVLRAARPGQPVRASRQFTGEYKTVGPEWPPPLPEEPGESGPPPVRPTGGQD